MTNTGTTTINGDLGVSPGTAVTGSPVVTPPGTIHANDAVAAQAQVDLTTAYNNAAAQPQTANVAEELAGLTLTEGVYKATSTLGLNGQLTLNGEGNPASVFIFQTDSTLITGSASSIVLTNGAQACNVFWQVGSSATLGTTTSFKGTVLALASVTVQTGATIEGRALARNGAVTLDSNVITTPYCVTTPTETAVPPETGTPTSTAVPSETTEPTPTATSTETAPGTGGDGGDGGTGGDGDDGSTGPGGGDGPAPGSGGGTGTATATASGTATASATATPTSSATTTQTATATAKVTSTGTALAAKTGAGDRNHGTNVDTAAQAFDTRAGGTLTPSGAVVVGLAGVGGILIAACLMLPRRRDNQA